MRLLFLLFLPVTLIAQVFEIPNLLQPAALAGPWKYHPGDDLRWADPAFDDSTRSAVPMPDSAILTLRGRGWFRLQVRLPERDSSLPLAVLIGPFGKSAAFEFYVNGERLASRGDPGGSMLSSRVASPVVVDLPQAATYNFAFRVNIAHAPHQISLDAHRLVSRIGQRSQIVELDRQWHLELRSFLLPLVLVCAAVLTLAVVFILIGAWQSDAREYLWLGLYFLCQGVIHVSVFDPEWVGVQSSLVVTVGASVLASMIVVLWTSMCHALFRSRWTTRSIVWTVLGSAIFLAPPILFFAELPYHLHLNLASLITVPLLFGASYYEAAWRQASQRRSFTGIDAAIIGYLPLVVAGYFMIGSDFGERSIRNAGIWREGSLVVFFGLSMVVLLNRRTARMSAEQVRLKQELEAGAEMQTLLLPSKSTHVPGFSIEAVYLPASEVGGDFYHALPDGDALVVLVGDVSGKGLRAAMIVTLIIGVLRNTAERQPAALLHSLNRALAGQMRGGFVTCCAARFQQDGQVIFANAGHLAPYVEDRELELESGLPLGLTADCVFAETSVRGRSMALVSDGVVEAANSAGELFGFDRVREIVRQPAAMIAESAKAWGQNDDITVVTVQLVGGA